MEWKEAIEDERRAMKRHVSRLLSFAAIADSLARVPWAMRCFILWLLRWAESIMLGVIDDDIDLFGRAGLRLLENGPTRGSRRADCVRLARRFRAMARLFERMAVRLARLGRERRNGVQGHVSRYETELGRLRRLARQLAAAFDISGVQGPSASCWTRLDDRAELAAESWNSS